MPGYGLPRTGPFCPNIGPARHAIELLAISFSTSESVFPRRYSEVRPKRSKHHSRVLGDSVGPLVVATLGYAFSLGDVSSACLGIHKVVRYHGVKNVAIPCQRCFLPGLLHW